MQIPARWALGMPLGGLAAAAACTLAGGHVRDLFAPGPAMLVLGIAIVSFVAGRGLAASRLLLRSLATDPSGSEQRLAVIADVARLERGALHGAVFGVLWAASDAIGNVHSPTQIGPALAFALQCLVVATLLSAFVWLPLRQHLLPEVEARLPARRSWSRALAVGGLAALLCAATAANMPGLPQIPLLTPTSLLMIVGAALPSLLAAPQAIACGPITGARAGWLADALCCASVLGVTTGVAHCFAVLDHPHLLAPGLAAVASGFAVPTLVATLLRLYGAPRGDDTPPHLTSASPHPGFVAAALAALVGMVVFVVALLHLGAASS